jgi:hypothetical protein
MYFERLSRDGNRGIIIPKRTAPGAITVLPKGLRPAARYLVSFRESDQTYQRRGSDLMKAGIHLDKMLPGELIYLNLPYHPGSKLFKTPPTAPTEVRKQPATGMSYPGIELTWRAGRDRQWVSYFEVLRNGSVIDKVAKGTYYFDHSAGADMAATYAVRTVNGGGLRSGEAPAAGPQTKPSVILDDAPGGGITFSGDWRREDKLQPAYAGTLARSDQKGASFEFPATGSRFIWFTRLCNECGRAEVAIDGQREAVMDTYSADDIFGVGLFAKSFVDGRAHRVKITVLGEHGGPRGKGMLVYLDGIRIER